MDPGLPTRHVALASWVAEVAAHCRPDTVHCCDGSPTEAAELVRRQLASGTAIALDPARRPGCLLVRTAPEDTARREDRTLVCSPSARDVGPTNLWRDPQECRDELWRRYAGAMRGRTLYVVPFRLGPAGSPYARHGVELTDSPYVASALGTLYRTGAGVLAELGTDRPFIPCLHSVGAPLAPGQADVAWPCAPEPWIAHFTAPHERAVWAIGSGYGGNAVLAKKGVALRIASVLAREEGWLAEHMLILGLRSPSGRQRYIAAAFPSACGKTNLAMLRSALPGWAVTCVGDDIAWLHIGADGGLRAINPEAGFFGVAPGTSSHTNPAAIATIAAETVFTNVALTPEGDVWWEGLSDPPPHLTDWTGRPWTPGCGRPAAHPNARYTVRAARCPVIDPRWEDPAGVPIDAILVGGRRARTLPLVLEAPTWNAGVFLGATCASETTAAASGATGELRRDPFAMRPFLGYHLGDHLAHWLAMGRRCTRPPRFFAVNWFRRGADGRFLWPGFGENARVLAWIARRLDDDAAALSTPAGWVPTPEALDLHGLDLPTATVEALLAIDRGEWRAECDAIATHFAAIGDRLPPELAAELASLRARLAD